jgi:hypothetical protein
MASSSNTYRFVHEGFRPHQAQWLVQQGRLAALGRGIYVDTESDERAVMADIFPVFAYRYPESRLMGESARRCFLLDQPPQVADGSGRMVIYATGSLAQRYERPLINDIQMVFRPEKPDSPFLQGERGIVTLNDGGQSFFQPVTPAQMLFDSARHQECAIPAGAALALLENLPAAHRDYFLQDEAMRKAVETWKRSTAQVLVPEIAAPDRSRVDIFLQDHPVGYVSHNGISWKAHVDLPVNAEKTESFLQSLLPETAENLGSDQRQSGDLGCLDTFLTEPRRLMNFVLIPGEHRGGHITENGVSPSRNAIPKGGELSLHSNAQGVFTGMCIHDFMGGRDVAQALRTNPMTPRLSGLQTKAAAHLDAAGHLKLVDHIETPFTVIAKMDPPIATGLTGIPVLEWACQRAARMAGHKTPDHALVVAMNGQSATLLSQRFDVPSCDDRSSLMMALDGAAIVGVPTDKKYEVGTRALWRSIESFVGKTENIEHATAFFDRFALAWAMADGDLHAKNMSLLFRKNTPDARWDACMSPAYDTVCTRALVGFGNDRQALRIEGKDDGLNPKLWKRFGNFLGVADGDARAARISAGIVAGFRAIAGGVPDLFDGAYRTAVEHLMDRATQTIEQRAFKVMGVSESDISQVPLNPSARAPAITDTASMGVKEGEPPHKPDPMSCS